MDFSFLYENRKQSDITFLGTHHWKNYGLDAINAEQQDMQTETRQQEIIELLERLQSYKPTKIFLEWPMVMQEKLDERYKEYLEGNLDLSDEKYLWEGYQLGFRLAKMLGHQRIYGIDNRDPEKTDLPIDKVMELLRQKPDAVVAPIMQKFMPITQQMINDLVQLPLVELYREHNSDEFLYHNQMMYYLFAEVGEGWESVGLEVATRWYKRNLDISNNISKLLDFQAEERSLVIIGQGHVPYLRDNAERSPFFSVTSILDYLQ